MPRQRSRKNRQLPNYVYKAKGRYFIREYLGSEKGKPKFGRDIRLAPATATIAEVWAAYDKHSSNNVTGTLSWLAEQYFHSPQYQRLLPYTHKLYGSYWATISSAKTRSGNFGQELLTVITPGVIRRYLDRRAGSPVQANKERGFMVTLFGYAVERDWMRMNPAISTKPFPTEPRTRYIEDSEFDAIFSRALPYVQDAMELAFLLRGRMSEVLDLRIEDLIDDGVLLRRLKGSKTQVIAWTPRLRNVVDCARSRRSTIASFYIIHDHRGQKIRRNTLQSAWGRMMRKAMKEDVLKERFTFHDLKAKGVSDFCGDKLKASGHKSHRMAAIYDRKIEIVPATE